jgi:hypothetical protein
MRTVVLQEEALRVQFGRGAPMVGKLLHTAPSPEVGFPGGWVFFHEAKGGNQHVHKYNCPAGFDTVVLRYLDERSVESIVFWDRDGVDPEDGRPGPLYLTRVTAMLNEGVRAWLGGRDRHFLSRDTGHWQRLDVCEPPFEWSRRVPYGATLATRAAQAIATPPRRPRPAQLSLFGEEAPMR